MQTLPLKMSEEIARKLYPTTSPEWQSALEDTFGKTFFTGKIIDRVKSFEDACAIKGVCEMNVLPYNNPDDPFKKALNAIAKIWLIIEVINEGWKADLSNTNQDKYYPWFKQKSGFGLSYRGYGRWFARTDCGVRLALETYEKAEYVGKQFLDIYQEFMIIQ